MSRHTVIGNGNMLVCLDENGEVRDLYYPRAGLENHVVGQKHRLGISINNAFYWLKNFDIYNSQSSNSLKSTSIYKNEKEQIELEFESVVYNEKSIFVRKITVKNKGNENKLIKLFFNQEFKIKENKYRNTAFYYPPNNVVIHYRGRRVFLLNIFSETGGINDYTIGLYDFEGREGSYLSAEKLDLPKNSVEHGPVDSVIAKNIEVMAGQSNTLYYTVIAGKTVDEVLKTNEILQNEKSPQHIITTTVNYWNAWKNKRDLNFYNLDNSLVQLYYKSLFVIKSHIDNKDGGIIASSDSTMYMYGKDSYAYVWPRDAGYIAKAMLKAGYFSDAKKVIEFFAKTISNKGYILHKFELDKSLGSSWHSWIKNGEFEIPIQEDETAMILHLLWEYFNLTKDIEFVEKYEEVLVERSADFMCEFIDKRTNLPLKSYDLWEENYKTFTYTTCTVIDALTKAANLSEILGKVDNCKKYSETADKIKKALYKHLYTKNESIFYKSVESYDNEIVNMDKTADSSTLYGLWYFNIINPNLEQFKNFENYLLEKLKRPDGMFLRYENDPYFKKEGQPSNPWIITTLWYLQLKITRANTVEEIEKIAKELEIVLKMKVESGIFPEQVDSVTLKPESATPLIWSHACFVETISMYMNKAEELGMGESGLPK